jgi:acid phosphatase family membrane protein YuiD
LSEHDTNIRTDKLKVLVGHTPLQVVCGALLGIACSCLAEFVILAQLGI